MNLNMFKAIQNLYPQVVRAVEDIAYDVNGNEIAYDLLAAQAKLLELITQEETAAQAKIDARQAALNKLMALGLTEAEALALGGTV